MTAAAAFFASHRSRPELLASAEARCRVSMASAQAGDSDALNAVVGRANDHIAAARCAHGNPDSDHWAALLTVADEEEASRFIEGFWIVLASLIGVSALFVAIDNIHIALGMVLLAGLLARWATRLHRHPEIDQEGA